MVGDHLPARVGTGWAGCAGPRLSIHPPSGTSGDDRRQRSRSRIAGADSRSGGSPFFPICRPRSRHRVPCVLGPDARTRAIGMRRPAGSVSRSSIDSTPWLFVFATVAWCVSAWAPERWGDQDQRHHGRRRRRWHYRPAAVKHPAEHATRASKVSRRIAPQAGRKGNARRRLGTQPGVSSVVRPASPDQGSTGCHRAAPEAGAQ